MQKKNEKKRVTECGVCVSLYNMICLQIFENSFL